ncbi:MAG: hypothetical protein FJ044_03025 [Candidatus Cloacimonetes bacterium]|nr:hypothetical protein [Candidatus Cloacimonadota bacterium]
MDATQLLLSIMIFLLGVTLTVIGIQFYFVLKELKKSVEKVNIMLDDVHILSKNLADGSQQIQSLLTNFRQSTQSFAEKIGGPMATGLAVFGLIKKMTEKFSKRKLEDSE